MNKKNLSTADNTKLKVLIVSIPRAGSTSMCDFVQEVYQLNTHRQIVAKHDSYPSLYSITMEAILNSKYEKITNFFNQIEYEVESTTYNLWHFLPQLLEILPLDVKIIILYREKMELLHSLSKRVHLYPHGYKGYTDIKFEPYTENRLTAYHLGEMTYTQWYSLSKEERLKWFIEDYMKKINSQISDDRIKLFNINNLKEFEFRKDLVGFINPEFRYIPNSVHKHLSQTYFNIDIETAKSIDIQLGEFDWNILSKNPNALLEYILLYKLKKDFIKTIFTICKVFIVYVKNKLL